MRAGASGLARTGGGVSRYDPEALPGQPVWTTLDKSNSGLAHNKVWPILKDRDGHLWLGTGGGGVSRYVLPETPNQGTEGWTTFTKRQGLVDDLVTSICQDRAGRFWFGTPNGVSRYDPSAAPKEAWTSFTTKDGLVHNSVYSIFQDQEGFLWFGTDGGVSRYDNQVFTTFTESDGLFQDDVYDILLDRDENLWFSGGRFSERQRGVTRYDGKTFTTFTTKDGLPHNQVRSMFQDEDGDLWFGTSGGVSRYDGEVFVTFTTKDGLPDNSVVSIYRDREGNLWFGTAAGACRYDGKTFRTFTKEDGLSSHRVWSIFQASDGYLWFGTQQDGAVRYDGENFFSFAEEFRDTQVYSVSEDREGRLWFTTRDKGVRRYDPEKGWIRLTVTSGLVHDRVLSLFQDRDGDFWFGTRGAGVSRYNPSLSRAEDDLVFQTLSRLDGLASNVVGGIVQDLNGDFWFATNRGVTRYRPQTTVPPPVFVDAVVADRRITHPTDLAVPSNVDLIAFEFHGISVKTRPGGIVYRYRLKGHDENWGSTTARRVEYSDLPLGDYTFEVYAVDRDLVSSALPASVALMVRLPYERLGMIAALAVALLLGLWQTARVIRRDRRLVATNQALEIQIGETNRTRELAEQANLAKSTFLANMSHEIRTPLNAILGYTQILDSAQDLPDHHRNAIETIERSGEHLLGLINDVLDISKIEAGRTELNAQHFDLHQMIETIK
jgi:ligand-binding sensor domain-containing protein